MQRKALHQVLNETSMASCQLVQAREMRALLKRLLVDPIDFITTSDSELDYLSAETQHQTCRLNQRTRSDYHGSRVWH
jgi:hypothetical protein